MMIREVGKWYLYVVVVEAVESGASASSRQMYVFVVIVVVDSLRPWRLGPSRTRNTEITTTLEFAETEGTTIRGLWR